MPLFTEGRPVRVGVLFSGGASGFRYLREHDPNYGTKYDVVCGVSTDPTADGIDRFEAAGVPVETRDIRTFYAERGTPTGDLDDREVFDAATRDLLEDYGPDLVLLSGYMWILTGPVIDAYPTINVHPADLRIESSDGDREYVGYDPVYDAVVAGEPETRSSVHFVTSDVDAGPIAVVSEPFAVHEPLVGGLERYDAEDGIRAYADAHQEWMKWAGDGPAIATAIELIADGRLGRSGSAVTIDGTAGYYDLGVDRVRERH